MHRIAGYVRASSHGDARQALVLPTTTATLGLALANEDPRVVVAAPWLGDRYSLGSFVENLAGARCALVFSDQLTGPLDAPWCVEWDGTARYLPIMEAAAQRAGFQVHAWTESGFAQASVEDGPLGIARLLRRYLAACESIGDGWLAREAQVERLRRVRSNDADQRLRLLVSAVLHASLGEQLAPVEMQAIRRARELQHLVRRGALA